MAWGSRWRTTLAIAVFLSGTVVARGQAAEPAVEALEFFETKIRPLLADNCFNCHSADTNSQGGLRVDDRNGLLAGGGRGPAVVPGDPQSSLLVQAILRTHPEIKMPPEHHLAEGQIADVMQWIRSGAVWTKVEFATSLDEPNAEYERLRAEHWSWQPLRKPPAPQVKDISWPRGQIDRFLLARMESQDITPVQDASATALVRRIFFDLIGLPPTPEEADEFVGAYTAAGPEPAQAEIAELVDQLLASPAFGEHWGRHWLDVARYGESTGSARNVPYPHAWRYRDYVIDAFNSDKPYDQFLREQIAGDLISAQTQQARDEQLIATGFLALGVCDVNQRFKVRFVMDNVDEQIDTVGRAVLGLTVGCARCHDHMFDPIPTSDYYALAGIFRSSDRCAGVRNKMGGGGLDYYDTAMLIRLGPEIPDQGITEKIAATKTLLAAAKKHLGEQEAKIDKQKPDPEQDKKVAEARQQVTSLQNELVTLGDPATHGPLALGVRDAATVSDTELRVRGEAEKLGPLVPRGYLSMFEVPDAPAINPNQSGRLELAQWLTSKHNPLTPRVMVNRVWQYLFGQGLVTSVDNFGVTGDAPSHPELLDHLATRFIEHDWSIKKLVREIVLSRAYQLSSDAPAAQLAIDPANRLCWRHSSRRLQAEEIRDAMLLAAGEIDLSRPAGSPIKDFKVIELPDNGSQAAQLEAICLASKQRSVYLPLLRGLTPRALEVFDFAQQGFVTGRRDTTTVATQALYLLNDPFVRGQSQVLAGRMLRGQDGGQNGGQAVDDAGRINLAYRMVLCRPATAGELERAATYLREYEADARVAEVPADDLSTAAWSSLCQAIFASAEFRYLQ